ncbi:DUF4365 domain-containing protein [Duganella sp. BJB475]|uniref:DUF4365 domain-containing protein n=1 Tax=Duganella sp. BJB475 TaxID=2233914 RepID=UPI000E354B1B|nr:DUF4365 domain-containing protein [Duganella sp. BJB475]RFP09488.1 DUF4365 domain-containing protein [Duganella sp. BJB475]
MNAKEIGRTAGRIFAYRLPPNWILRSQEDQEDYGIDGEIEIASPDDKATGFIFKAQIKGQERVSYINSGTHISFNLSVDRLRYYMQQIETAIILAVVATDEKKVFWTSLQDNTTIANDLKKALGNGQKTVAVHLRSEDTIPERTDELLVAVKRNMDWLRIHALDRLTGPIDELLHRSHDDVLKALLNKSKKLQFEIFNEQFERLYTSENHKDLLDIAQKVIHSATELVQTRVVAGLYIERLLRQELDSRDPRELAALGNLYGLMLQIVRSEKAPSHIRRYVLMLVRILRLEISVNSDYHYFVSAKRFARDSLTGWIIASSRVQVSGRATRDVVKTVHLVNRAVLAGQHGLLLEALPRFVGFMALFVHRLKEDQLSAQAEPLVSWLEFCVELSIDVARETKNFGALAEAIAANAFIDLSTDGKAARIEKSLTLAATIEHDSIREGLQERLRALRDQEVSEEELTPDKEIEMFRHRAIGLGIDVDNPLDEFGQIIQQGLLDYNPERVVKDCESLIMVPTRSLGVPAQMVGLPSAGMKFLHCLKKGHTMGGWRLDDVYMSPIPGTGFKAHNCDTCEFRKARDEKWKWSSKWQHGLAEEHSEVFERMGKF